MYQSKIIIICDKYYLISIVGSLYFFYMSSSLDINIIHITVASNLSIFNRVAFAIYSLFKILKIF